MSIITGKGLRQDGVTEKSLRPKKDKREEEKDKRKRIKIKKKKEKKKTREKTSKIDIYA